MRLLAFDLETTGLDPQRDQVLEIGAVAFDPEDQNGDNDAIFSCIVDPGRIEGDPFALQMNADILFKIARGDGATPEVAWTEFDVFVGDACDGRKPHPVGFNVAAFDVAFAKAAGFGHLFHHRPIELGSLIPRPDGSPSTSSQLVGEILNRNVAHLALHDAQDAAAIYRWWYQQSVSLKPEPNPNQGDLPFPGSDGDQTR